MQIRYENPLKGKPYTKETRDAAGKLQYEILPNTLTPLRAKVADKLASLVTVLMALLYVFSSICCWRGYEELFWQVVVFLLFYFFGQDAVRDLFYKKSRITLNAEEIVVGFWVFKKHYRRNLEHRFSLLTHDRARDEQRQASIKAQKLSKSGKIETPIHISRSDITITMPNISVRHIFLAIRRRSKSSISIFCAPISNAPSWRPKFEHLLR